MSQASDATDTVDPASRASEVRLDLAAQKRNVLIYSCLAASIFLAAPALYVGFVQASLCKRLNASDTIANLPSTAYLLSAGAPVIVAWLFPQARLLKPLLRLGYMVMAVVCAGVAVVLVAGASREWIIGALVLHAGLVGCANGVVLTHGWEMIRRAVSDELRGKAFQFAYGFGACFAVIGSLGTQLLLDAHLFGWTAPAWMRVPYPYSYALLFVGCACVMAFAAFLARYYQIPLPSKDATRESFAVSVLGGFKAIFGNSQLLIICLAYLLIYFGNMVQVNMSLFSKEAVGIAPEDVVGYQLALRFSFKVAAGLGLGWLMTRTHPKAPLLVTVGLQIACVLWILAVPGYWFLVAFGLNGAGELFGVYYVNYAVSCSPKSQVRRNTSFLYFVSGAVAAAPVLYGWISDHWGLRASFIAALGIFFVTALLVATALPARPRPRASDLSPSDLAGEA